MTWLYYALASSITWSFVTIFGRMAAERVDTTLITTIRAVFMSVSLIIMTLFIKRINISSLSTIETKDWVYILLASLASSVSWLCYFAAFKYGFISKVITVDRISFIFIMLMSAFVFNEPLTFNMILGGSLMVIGIVLIAYK